MSTQPSLSAIADEVVSRYGDAATSLLSAYDRGVRRAVSQMSSSYEQLLGSSRVPLSEATRQGMLQTERKLATFLVDGVARVTGRASRTVGLASNRTRQGVAALAKNTLFVVGAVQLAQLPAARLSLRIASEVAGASRRLAELAASEPTRVAKSASTPRPRQNGVGVAPQASAPSDCLRT